MAFPISETNPELPPGTYKLPDDIERIVKALAKPVFIQWRLFNEAKLVVPKRHLNDLREVLSGTNADNVCKSLTAYIGVCRKLTIAENELNDYRDSIDDFGTRWCHETRTVIVPNLTQEQRDTTGRLRAEARIYLDLQFKTYRALLVEMHGEAVVEYAEYLDKRRKRYGWNAYGNPLTLQDWDEADGYYEDE